MEAEKNFEVCNLHEPNPNGMKQYIQTLCVNHWVDLKNSVNSMPYFNSKVWKLNVILNGLVSYVGSGGQHTIGKSIETSSECSYS